MSETVAEIVSQMRCNGRPEYQSSHVDADCWKHRLMAALADSAVKVGACLCKEAQDGSPILDMDCPVHVEERREAVRAFNELRAAAPDSKVDVGREPDMQRLHDVWRVALILAHNICIQDSDRANDSDRVNESNALCETAKRLKGWMELENDAQLREILIEGGCDWAAASAVPGLQAVVAKLEKLPRDYNLSVGFLLDESGGYELKRLAGKI